MKKTALLYFALLFLISCSSDNEDDEQHCNFDTEVPECCFTGSDFASKNETLVFTNKFPEPNADMEWEILHGDITIINVENTVIGDVTKSVATIKFNTDFSIGRIAARGSIGPPISSSCSHYHNIRLPD